MQLWVDKLISEYSCDKKRIEKYKDTLQGDDIQQQQELKIVRGMITDMAFAIEWMKKGRMPGSYRGADRRGVYRQNAILDVEMFPSLQEPEQVSSSRISPEQRTIALDAIHVMSERERVCYLLHVAQGMSYSEIALNLQIAKASVQRYVDRARKKIPQS